LEGERIGRGKPLKSDCQVSEAKTIHCVLEAKVLGKFTTGEGIDSMAIMGTAATVL
jgi:hypothetical protein